MNTSFKNTIIQYFLHTTTMKIVYHIRRSYILLPLLSLAYHLTVIEVLPIGRVELHMRVKYTGKHPIQIQRTTHTSTIINSIPIANSKFIISMEGKCTYLIGDRIYILSPGDLIIMHGMTLHRPKVDNNYVYDRTTIHFDPSYVQQLIKTTLIRLTY